MSQIKTDRSSVPVDREHDPELVAFRAQIDDRSPLDELTHRSHRQQDLLAADWTD